MNKIVLAVVGLTGAGKTTATDYLVKKTAWPKVYFGQAVIDEVKNRGWTVNEENERKVREEFRAKGGMAALAVANMYRLKSAFEQSSVIIESLYSWEEYIEVKKEFGEAFKVLAIFASPDIRAYRMARRPARPLSGEELVSRDYSQIENLHQAGPIARADFTVVNEGSLEELYIELDKLLGKIKM